MPRHLQRLTAVLLATMLHTPAFASGVAIDKIYQPYVESLEHELEYRVVRFENDDHPLDNVQLHKLGYGQALAEHWAGEIYIIGSNPNDAGFDIEGYEAEARWQVTEQGEYAVDTGLLFELERETGAGIWEASAALLLTKEISRWLLTTNLYLIHERGDNISTETEMAANFQFLYRLNAHLEPALEIYRAQDTFGIGPLLTGTERLGIGKKLHWEFGVIGGFTDDTPDITIKGLLEYEF